MVLLFSARAAADGPAVKGRYQHQHLRHVDVVITGPGGWREEGTLVVFGARVNVVSGAMLACARGGFVSRTVRAWERERQGICDTGR